MSLMQIAKMLAIGALSMLLAGCEGFDGVQLNGKIFDAMGMNTSSVKKTPKLAERPGIVVPPDLARLPEPGSGKTEVPEVAEVQDYDAKRSTSQADLEKQQEEYCKKHYDDAKIHGDQDAVLAEGPLGQCQKSALSVLKSFNKDDE